MFTVASETIRAGKLRHRISIVTQTLVQDSFGGTSILDTELFVSARASIEALTGKELITAQQKVSEVTHRVTIRFRRGILAKMNVQYVDAKDNNRLRMFQIEAIENPNEESKMLSLLCIERDDSALLGVT
jgi:SPP1 family predicted phage head-tail adaptor